MESSATHPDAARLEAPQEGRATGVAFAWLRLAYLLVSVAACVLMVLGATLDWKQIDRGIILWAGSVTFFLVAAWPWMGRRYRREPLLTPPFVLAGLVYLWHMGMVLPYALGMEVRNADYYLFSRSQVTPAALLCCAAVVAYLLGDRLAGIDSGFRRRGFTSGANLPDSFRRRLTIVLAGVYLAGLVAMGINILAVGPSEFFATPYAVRLRYFEQSFGSQRLLVFGMIVITAVLPWLFLVVSRRGLYGAIALLSLHVGVLGWLGYRSAAFPPLVGAILAWQLPGRRVRVWLIALLVVGVLISLPLLRAVRTAPDDPQQAVAKARRELAGGLVFRAVEELGRTFTTVTRTLTVVPGREEYGWGDSYAWGALEALPNPTPFSWEQRTGFERRGTWIARVTNPRGFRERRLGLGYSIVAEAYYNFGAVGGIVFLGLVGYGLGRLYNASLTRGAFVWRAAMLTVFCALFVGARNDAASYLRRIGWGLVLLLLAWWAAKIWSALTEVRRPPARPVGETDEPGGA